MQTGYGRDCGRKPLDLCVRHDRIGSRGHIQPDANYACFMKRPAATRQRWCCARRCAGGGSGAWQAGALPAL